MTHVLTSMAVVGAPAFLRQTSIELLLFGGKGGVGKTTCAAATAVHLAQNSPSQRFMVVSTDPAHSLADCFAGSALPSNLDVLEIDSEECLRKFKRNQAEHLRQVALRGTFLDDHDVAQLLELSLPGMDEVMSFLEISALVESGDYSCIVVDTAPSGHALRLIEMADVLRKWLQALDAMLAKHRFMAKLYRGFYRKDKIDVFLEDMEESIDSFISLLCDRTRCHFVPVMVAEPLSVHETRRLVDKLEAMKVPVEDILVNQVYPPGDDCPGCAEARGRSNKQMRTLAEEFSGHGLWEIPLLGAEVRGVGKLTGFWDNLRPIREEFQEHSHAPAALSFRVDHPAKAPDDGLALLLFGGKGGVGKTTLATATALHLAQRRPDREVLLFSADPAHSLSDCLEKWIGPRPIPVCPGLSAMEVNAEAEFAKLKKQYAEEVAAMFHSIGGHTMLKIEFDREAIERFMDLAPPGLDEAMTFTRVVDLLETGKYNTIVLDTAATGHLIRLLQLPALIQDWLRFFFGILLKYKHLLQLPKISELLVSMSKRLKVLQSLLGNPRKGRFFAVSILTEMAFLETGDLLKGCRRAGMHVADLFLNLATPPGKCPLCGALAERESELRGRFQEAFGDCGQSVIYRCGEPRGIVRLRELGQALYRD